MAGGTMANIVDIISFHKDVRAIPTIQEVSKEFFKGQPPAWTAVGYPGGYFEGHLHEICAQSLVAVGEIARDGFRIAQSS